MHKIICSLVTYNTPEETVADAIGSFLSTGLDVKLYLVDNSPDDKLRALCGDQRIVYIHNPSNPGYGSAHNIAIRHTLSDGAEYHLVMNPDIWFSPGTLEDITGFMDKNHQVGSLMPKILNEDGSLQRLCKLLPSPVNLAGRRFFSGMDWAKKKNELYELHHFNYDEVLNTPCLSGCFMFIRASVLQASGIFDPRYFMYLEDYDLTRRIHRIAETIFYPGATAVHGHAQESYKNTDLLKVHMRSAIAYFNKWGWLVDKERSKFNQKVLDTLGQKHQK